LFVFIQLIPFALKPTSPSLRTLTPKIPLQVDTSAGRSPGSLLAEQLSIKEKD
jgi:hypothetical protein